MAVDLTLAKSHLRVDSDDENDLITHYLGAAKNWVEEYTSKKLARETVTQTESCFGTYVYLRWGPAPSDVSVDYTDSDDVAGTLTDGRLVGSRLYPPVDGWPSLADRSEITVSYEAGYTTVPVALDQAVLLLISHFFENREAVNIGNIVQEVPLAVESLCTPYRTMF